MAEKARFPVAPILITLAVIVLAVVVVVVAGRGAQSTVDTVAEEVGPTSTIVSMSVEQAANQVREQAEFYLADGNPATTPQSAVNEFAAAREHANLRVELVVESPGVAVVRVTDGAGNVAASRPLSAVE